MSGRRATFLLLVVAPWLIAADKPVLVPDISARKVEIRYSFTGAQLLLFGAIVYPGGRPPPRTADIVVVLVTVAFFALALGYVGVCERLGARR